jgi:hypothetical protein
MTYTKMIVKKSEASEIGSVQKGTGPGTKFSAFTVSKVSKSFTLKDGSFLSRFASINCKPGDQVVFVYA